MFRGDCCPISTASSALTTGSTQDLLAENGHRARSLGRVFNVSVISYLNSKQFLERLSVERSRTVIHNRVQKTDLQPPSDAETNNIAVDETAIQLNNERHRLYSAVDRQTNELPHIRPFKVRTTERTMLFLRELRENVLVTYVTI